jgi:cell division protein FtsQ
MRPVERKRKSARSSAKPPRGNVRSSRASAPRQNFGRRGTRRENPFRRLAALLAETVVPSRPMLMMTGAFLAVAFVVALFVGGYIGRAIHAVNEGVDAIVSDAGFGITSVHLSGARRTPPGMILAALGFAPGQSIFSADLQAARARLMRLAWVSDAEVSRTYPDSISVSIVEKLPFALWESGRDLYVVERSGAPIARVKPAEFRHLPLFLGDAPIGGADLADAIATHPALVARVRAIQRVSGRRWNLLLDDGVVVKLPEQNWARQLGVLEKLIVEKGVLERDIDEIDLRSPDNYFFKLRGQSQQQHSSTKHPKESAA